MAEYFKGSTSVLVAFSIVSLAVYFIVKILQAMKPQHRYPPALPSIPFLGSFPLFKNRGSIHRYFADKSKQLGSIFSCYLGSRLVKEILDDTSSICPVSTGISPHSLPEWAFRARPGLGRICLCPKVARIAEHKFANR